MSILVAGLILFLGVHLLPILPGPRIGTVAALEVMALHRILLALRSCHRRDAQTAPLQLGMMVAERSRIGRRG